MSLARDQRSGAAASGIAGTIDSGFTIVELLVVISIVSLLAAMLLPTLNKARQQANSLSCQARLQQIGEAIQIYISVSKGVLPFGYWDGTFNPANGSDRGMSVPSAADWTQLLQRNVFVNSPGTLQAKLRELFFDPEGPPGDTVNSLGLTLVQYACHPRLMPLMGTEDKYAELASGGSKCFLRPYKIARVKRSSEVSLIFDASLNGVTGGGYSVVAEPVGLQIDGGRILSDSFLTDQYNLAATAGFVPSQSVDMTPAKPGGLVNTDDSLNPQNLRFRHLNNRVCNALMLDFHVESFTWTTSGGTELKRLNVNVNP